jgi:hypothetical protein
MAIKSVLDFGIKLIGDGTDRVYVIDTATGPFGLSAPYTGAGVGQLSPALSLGSMTPNGVLSLTSGNGHAVSGSVLAGVLTITYAVGDALAINEVDLVQGLFTFPG